jgi:hypothetical protein
MSDTSGAQYDAPNQQVVRADGSGPADEGTGASVTPTDTPVSEAPPAEGDDA